MNCNGFTATNTATGGPVTLANHSNSSCSGTALMLTTVFDGMRDDGTGLSIEGCWWAVVNGNATLRPGHNSTDFTSALLIGSGVEDLFGNAFGLSWASCMYHNSNTRLSHIRGGPSPDNNGYSGTGPRATFFSAYKMFDGDPLL